jgi:hypothetical protein
MTMLTTARTGMARTATTIEAIMRAQAWLANAEEGRPI